jgi:Flp pilus assembly protein TadG
MSYAVSRDAGGGMLSRRKSQGGQTVILVAAALPVLFGVVGLAFDIGYLEYSKRLAQTAADAGAVAGAIDLAYGNATAAAGAATAANGFTNGSGGVTVTVNNPPLNGPHTAANDPNHNTNYVEVIVQAPEPTFFLKMIGITTSTTVAGRGVATSTSGDCIFALASSGVGLNVPFLADINTPNCAIIVDSSSSNALSGFLGIFTASQIGVVGGGLGSGTGWANCFLCFFTPNPVNVLPLADPLAYLTPPTVAACAGTATNISTGTVTINPAFGCYNVTVSGNANVTFKPGEYASITVANNIAPTVTFNPGLYIIQGSGGLVLTGLGATITGNGVTFYMGPSAGGVSVATGGSILNNIRLVAQTTGSYAGILFFQDRSNANNACIGGCGASVSGLFNFLQVQGGYYFPDAQLSFDGCCQTSASSPVCTPPYCTAYEIVVAKNLSFTFDYFGDDYSSLPGGSPVKKTLLVE